VVKPTIALVDGRKIDRLLIKVTLGTRDWHVLETATTADVIAVARTIAVDVILIVMPPPSDPNSPDVAAVCRHLRASPTTSRAKIGVVHEQGRQPGPEAGADILFARPFSPTALLDWVHAAIGSRDWSSAM
jgi:CheY-like chemotaxis protein